MKIYTVELNEHDNNSSSVLFAELSYDAAHKKITVLEQQRDTFNQMVGILIEKLTQWDVLNRQPQHPRRGGPLLDQIKWRINNEWQDQYILWVKNRAVEKAKYEKELNLPLYSYYDDSIYSIREIELND